MRRFALVALLAVILVNVNGQDHFHQADARSQKKWLKQQVKELLAFSPAENLTPVAALTVDLGEYKIQSFKIKGETLIRFDDNSWIYIKSHSSHEDTLIGDISIAMSDTREFYINNGHICGGIIHFICKSDNPPLSKSEFIDCYVADTDDQPWILLKKYK